LHRPETADDVRTRAEKNSCEHFAVSSMGSMAWMPKALLATGVDKRPALMPFRANDCIMIKFLQQHY
jgi:hypothetical protein